jgi:hypothetical protein
LVPSEEEATELQEREGELALTVQVTPESALV